MRRAIATVLLLLGLLPVSGQVNLVPNPSFEDTVSCASGYPYDPATPAISWMALGSVDYFSDVYCNGVGPTSNVFGGESPFNGVGYFGFSAYLQPSNSDLREYLFTGLTATLTAGKKYCVSFYVSLADSMDIAIQNVGIAFTADSIPFNGPGIQQYMFSLSPQVESQSLLTDKIGWTKVQGEFVATGNEKFLTIGNFRTYNNTVHQNLNTPAWPYSGAYYYIDMVSVTEVPVVNASSAVTITAGDSVQLSANGGSAYLWSPAGGLSCTNCANPMASPSVTTTYSVAVLDSCGCSTVDSVTVLVLPKPLPGLMVPTLLKSGDLFLIDSLPAGTKLIFYDLRGRKLYERENYGNDFSTGSLPAATYVYEIHLPDARVLKGKFCVIH